MYFTIRSNRISSESHFILTYFSCSLVLPSSSIFLFSPSSSSWPTSSLLLQIVAWLFKFPHVFLSGRNEFTFRLKGFFLLSFKDKRRASEKEGKRERENEMEWNESNHRLNWFGVPFITKWMIKHKVHCIACCSLAHIHTVSVFVSGERGSVRVFLYNIETVFMSIDAVFSA